MNGWDGWTCTIFRRILGPLASDMILAAELALEGRTCGPSGLLTYVAERKIRSTNPGFCFKMAGYRYLERAAHKDQKPLLEAVGAPGYPCLRRVPTGQKRSGSGLSMMRA